MPGNIRRTRNTITNNGDARNANNIGNTIDTANQQHRIVSGTGQILETPKQ